jgi:hypothetical protein
VLTEVLINSRRSRCESRSPPTPGFPPRTLSTIWLRLRRSLHDSNPRRSLEESREEANRSQRPKANSKEATKRICLKLLRGHCWPLNPSPGEDQDSVHAQNKPQRAGQGKCSHPRYNPEREANARSIWTRRNCCHWLGVARKPCGWSLVSK